MQINPGDKVRDKITGFTGIVTSRTIWLNGCVRLAVQGSKLKDGNPSEAYYIDEPQLTIVKRDALKMPVQETGGERTAPQRATDPRR